MDYRRILPKSSSNKVSEKEIENQNRKIGFFDFVSLMRQGVLNKYGTERINFIGIDEMGRNELNVLKQEVEKFESDNTILYCIIL